MSLNLVVINYHKHVVFNMNHMLANIKSYATTFPNRLESKQHTNIDFCRHNSISHFTQIKTQLFIHIGIALYLQRMTNLQFRNLNYEFGDAILCCRHCFDLISVALSFELSPSCLYISDGYPQSLLSNMTVSSPF